MKKLKFKSFRSFLSIFLVALLIISTQAVTASAATATEDEASASKAYTVGVATEIQKFLTNSIVLSEEKQLEYDFNLDGRLTVADSTIIQKYIAGAIDQLPTQGTEPTTVTEPIEITEPTTAVLPEQLTLEQSSFVLGAGESVSLKITSDTMGQPVKFTSSNETVATVDQNGKITTQKRGVADIVCTLSKNNFVVCNLLVKSLPTEFSLNYDSVELGIAEYLVLQPVFSAGYTAYAPTFTSSNPNIVSVDSKTGYTVAKLAGTAKIYCTLANGAKAECAVTVNPPITSLSLSKSSASLKVGENTSITASANCNVSDDKLEWSSSNTYVAKLSAANGKTVQIIPMSQGSATITVKSFNGLKATCKVTVKDSVVKCIDVSSWQGDINFKSVKNAGYDYVILRAGFGNEISQKDNKFDAYYNAAKSAGLKVGAYWYSYAVDNDDALLEAKTCLKAIDGKALDMPIYYDVEDSTQMYYSKSKLSGICKTFCDYIYDNSKYYTGVYSSIGWYNQFDRSYIGSRHSYWVAQIDGDMSSALDFDIHQYTWALSVNGISTDVDGDKIYNLNIVR